MNKFNKWHQEQLFWFMEKLNLGVYEVAWISWIKGFIMGALLLLFCSCGVQFQYSLLNNTGNVDAIYDSSDLKVDTISSVFDIKRKLRTDFKFRYDFAQYAMQQPYSWYWNNPRLEGIWRPYNRFDVYFYSNWFWNDWAFHYPHYHYWGWNRPYYYYGWNRPYRPWNNWNLGPWHNSGYNIVYNASRRGSLTTNSNRNISTIVQTNRINNINNRPTSNKVINNLINNYKPSSSNYKPNNNIRINSNNNYKPNNNNYKPSYNNSRPTYNSSSTIRVAPTNTTRSSNINISRGNSKGKN